MACGGCQPPTQMRLLLRQPIVSALAAGEVTGTAERILILDLDSAGVVNAFTVTAHARQLTMSSTHEQMLPRKKLPRTGAIG